MMPSAVQHINQSGWGDMVNEFNHARFPPGNKCVSPVAFRELGGGTMLCPGGHFASTEILIFSALPILWFNLYPVGGKWTLPLSTMSPIVKALPVPD